MQYVARAAPVMAVLIALLLIGFADVRWQLRSLSARLQFTLEFQRRWVAYFEALRQGQPARDDYTWLAEHQTTMTAELGPADRIDYRAPFSKYVVQNYPALFNTLAAARSGRGAHEDMVALVDHLVISHGGVLRDGFNSLRGKRWNPIYHVGRGLRFVVSLPLLSLAWAGLLPAPSLERARSSWLFRVLQFVIAVVVAVAAVMTVVLGWSAFVVQLRGWFPWLP